MTNFTEKQRLFIAAKRDGYSNRMAALHSGYAHSCADQRASTLMRNTAVRAAIGGNRRPTNARAEILAGIDRHYDDPKAFLIDCMNNSQLPFILRLEAARALLPYMHARKGRI